MQSASYNIAHSNTDRRTQVLIQIKLIRNVLLINKAFKPKTGYLKRSSFEMLLLAMKIIQCNKNIHSITYICIHHMLSTYSSAHPSTPSQKCPPQSPALMQVRGPVLQILLSLHLQLAQHLDQYHQSVGKLLILYHCCNYIAQQRINENQV